LVPHNAETTTERCAGTHENGSRREQSMRPSSASCRYPRAPRLRSARAFRSAQFLIHRSLTPCSAFYLARHIRPLLQTSTHGQCHSRDCVYRLTRVHSTNQDTYCPNANITCKADAHVLNRF
jgi:hypothetical protein